MKIKLSFLAFFLITITQAQQSVPMATGKAPSFEDVLSLQTVSNAIISPNGKHVVYQKKSVDWKENRYDTELWLSKDRAAPFQLSNNIKANSSRAQWSPDGQWIAFLSNRNKKNQIFVIRLAGGEAFQFTDSKTSISSFEWSPNGKQIAFIKAEDQSKALKNKKEKFGGYAVEDNEFALNQLWVKNFKPDSLNDSPLPEQLNDTVYQNKFKAERLLKDAEFNINNFKWSPDGSKIAFGHQPDPLRSSFFKADISIYDTNTKQHKVLVSNPSFDGMVAWSPDGRSILYQTSLDNKTSNYYTNTIYFRIDIDGKNKKELAKTFDENISRIVWNKTGIYGLAWQKTKRVIIRISPENGKTTPFITSPERIQNFSFSDDEMSMAFTGVNDTDLVEVYKSDFSLNNSVRITNSSKQIEGFKVSNSEVISWKSKDSTIIEGILHKPQDFIEGKKYPLMVVIHGGPTGISTPSAAPSYVYPIVQWLNKGALVLMPNYRGSAGYGGDFRALNVRNLGVGDAWDVLSGVEHLKNEGLIDEDKVATMGWSQGGYISAFLSTNSTAFKAISVGVGISNWMTYYVSTDIHPFTRQYLKATPWSDKSIYEKTSPMTNINKAVTPTLIQHGEFDKRVPTANAYELFQGLQDVGVETKLIIYKGFGHGISKPKERLAAMWHNWQWFGKYIWGEDIVLPLD